MLYLKNIPHSLRACCLFLGAFIGLLVGCAESFFVVQREQGTLAVIDENKVTDEIKSLGDMNHATVKFGGDFIYVISRDGWLSKIERKSHKIMAKTKTGESGIGFTLTPKYIAVAQYDPKDIVFLDTSLKEVKRLVTGSRNVGIKNWGSFTIVSLMDKDEIWVIDENKDFAVVKKIDHAGAMPFDALLHQNLYLVGFFGENGVGILNMETLAYKKSSFGKDGQEVVMKIPHFGTWGIWRDYGFIPGVKERKLNIINLKSLAFEGSVELPGLPVFAAADPQKKYLAINYSGKEENMVTIIDPNARKIVKNLDLAGRVMHVRFSANGKKLLASSYFTNKVSLINVGEWNVMSEVSVMSPSGIFHHLQ